MELEELGQVLDRGIIEAAKTLGFYKGVVVPTKIVVEYEKFIKFIIKDKKEICIIANKEKVNKLSSVMRAFEKPFYLLIDDSLSDQIVVLYK